MSERDTGNGKPKPKYPEVFLQTFREVVEGLGYTIRRWLGESVLCANPSGGENTFGLENLYRRLRDEDQDRWPELIRSHLATLDMSSGVLWGDIDLKTIADRLLPRLRPDTRDSEAERLLWFQSVGAGIAFILVIDSADSMRYVTAEMIEKSGGSGEEWAERALTNLRRHTPADYFERINDRTDILWGHCNDAYDAARALILDAVLPDAAELGCFVAVPTRDFLLALPVSAPALAQTRLLKALSAGFHSSKPYPISGAVFWVRGGEWHPFGVHLQGDTVTLTPPAAFLDVYRRLTEGADPDEEG
jgi:uncharacterized protein YtpQ (UPF0354 family)